MEDALLLRLQLLLKRLNDSITLTTELCVQSKSEGVTEQEISIALNSLRAHTANVAKEIHIYIEKSTEINQDIVRRCTVLQLEAEDKIIALNSILNHIDSQKPETTQQTKLPKLSLLKFNGNILGWHDFWDQFEAGIHNKSLPDVDKLSYLLASLEGTAREAVEDSHYEELQKVTMAGSSATECRKVLNNIDKNLRILESLGEDINNNQLRVTILSKFPQKIIYELNMALKGADSTAVVTIKSQNEERKCRLLLDSGSQRSYITQQLADELKLVIDKVDQLIIFTFGSESPTQTESPSVKIELKTGRETTRKIRANVVPHITNRISVPKVDKKICVDLLADDGSAGEKIDILIGNDYYFSFFKSESKKLCDNLFLINTEFGWILSGKLDSDDQNILSIITYCQCHGPECMYYTEPDLPLRNIDLTFLWSLESIGILDSPKATREDEAVKHFNNNVKYVNQRYMIKWPWIQYPPEIPTNFGLAYGRLKGLLQRIDKNTLEEYEQILKAQLQSGTIELVEPEDDATRQRIPPLHYLPHHIVKQEGKKGRLVYDASGKLKNHKSLNECMYRGPSLIGDLLAILLQFRTYKIAITADVEKAFLQIGLQIEDRDVTRFLWLKHVNQPISKENLLHLRFCRVPFGIISSPFILTATINYHISQNYPDLLSKIADKCYVDNLVTGSKTVEEAQKFYKDTRRVFQDLSMNIREWNSNSPDFLKTIPQEYRAKTSAETKMLGLVWDTKKDTLRLKIRENLLDEQNTKQIQCKREVLSTIASVYDPCGFCSPLILPAKLLLQQLWENKLKWDTLLPEELKQKWDEVADSLRMVRNVAIPRFACIAPEEKTVTYELHCFTDASKDAYAAVLYLRSSNGVDTKVAFLISKSKITPKQDKDSLKIPKLELLGYYIGSKLILYVKNVIGLTIEHQYLWTDSMIVLGWMKSNKLLPPFVSRRINTIRQNKEIQPCYINTDSNPADVATRPDLWTEKNHLWFQGPSFLLKDKSEWPQSMYLGSEESSCVLGESLDGLCPDITMMTNDEEDINELTGCSSPKQGCYQLENTREVKNVKALQRKYFPNEVEGKVTHLTRNLGLYLDVDGVLRCRGRMANTNWSYDTKHPALIPRDSEYTSKLIQEIHEKNYHVGVSHTLSLIREKFWIPQGRAQVQKILRHCENCMKHGGGPYKLPPTSDLPAERVNLSAPFTYTGMDYFGPLYIIGEIGKEKRWVCLLTCLAVRAIHMEIVKDLTADECLLGLRRFVANRGKPVVIMTDNATLFKLTAEVVSDTIKWKVGKIISLTRGADGECRIAKVKVGNSEYTRSVGHLYPLEVNSKRNESEGLSEQVPEVEI
ncbi:uncharacterized protein LOC113238917, partial [Hyposmocoma kahamanoa]|uniref:uncharacterized protein LOC113238917 n=1 Tax=Hyposmocoma kahamanoa TaxID=1477025 RepID=UPI000E6D7F71